MVERNPKGEPSSQSPNAFKFKEVQLKQLFARSLYQVHRALFPGDRQGQRAALLIIHIRSPPESETSLHVQLLLHLNFLVRNILTLILPPYFCARRCERLTTLLCDCYHQLSNENAMFCRGFPQEILSMEILSALHTV